MRTLCVSVTEDAPDARKNVEALLDSLDRQETDLDVVLIVRGGSGGTRHERPRVRVHRVPAPRRIPLSVARNLALTHAEGAGLLERAAIVAFPDDDCRYPDGLLRRVAAHLDRFGGVVTGAYGPSVDRVDERRFPPGDGRLTPGRIMRTGCSGAMFFSGRAVRAVGSFDERLGLGAAYGASEDADYLLRALALGVPAEYRPRDVVVEHPYKAQRPAEYYVGNVAVLAKHARRSGAVRWLLARRLLGGLQMAMRSQLPVASLRRALGAALAFLGAGDRRQVLDAPCSEPAPQESDLPSEVPGFAPTASCAVDLDRPLRDLQIPASPDGHAYTRASVVVRVHEEPLGLLEIGLADGWLRARDLAAAIDRSLRDELAGHARRHGCLAASAVQASALEAGLGSADECAGARRSTDDALPAVAVIVPTAGRPDSIRRCLECLGALDYPRLEVIVVDNRPDAADTRSIVERAALADPRVRYVAERRPGSSVARNRGVAETRADIVAFTDDDVEVDRLWLRWIVDPFLGDEHVQAVTGLVLPASYDTPEQQRFERIAGFGKGFVRRVYDTKANRAHDQLLFPYWGAPFGSGNSMAFRRGALLELGGFDPALGAGSPALAGADIEAFTHVLLRGGRLVYEPRAIVWHEHRRDEAALARQLSNYRVGATAILTKWLLRDLRVLPTVTRALGAVLFRGRAGHAQNAPRELSRMQDQLASTSERLALVRQLGSFGSGPPRYLRSRLWARRRRLDAVLAGHIREAG